MPVMVLSNAVKVISLVFLLVVPAAIAEETTHGKQGRLKDSPLSTGTVSDAWLGTYESKAIDFVTVKRLTFTREKDGNVKITGTLVGFPNEVSIGEAIAEPYVARASKNYTDQILAKFSSEKFKPLLVIHPSGGGEHIPQITFTCYMKDLDGSMVHIEGGLNRKSD